MKRWSIQGPQALELLGAVIYRTSEGEKIVISEINRELCPEEQEKEEHRIVFCQNKHFCQKKANILGFVSFSCIACPMRLKQTAKIDVLDICKIAGL